MLNFYAGDKVFLDVKTVGVAEDKLASVSWEFEDSTQVIHSGSSSQVLGSVAFLENFPTSTGVYSGKFKAISTVPGRESPWYYQDVTILSAVQDIIHTYVSGTNFHVTLSTLKGLASVLKWGISTSSDTSAELLMYLRGQENTFDFSMPLEDLGSDFYIHIQITDADGTRWTSKYIQGAQWEITLDKTRYFTGDESTSHLFVRPPLGEALQGVTYTLVSPYSTSGVTEYTPGAVIPVDTSAPCTQQLRVTARSAASLHEETVPLIIEDRWEFSLQVKPNRISIVFLEAYEEATYTLWSIHEGVTEVYSHLSGFQAEAVITLPLGTYTAVIEVGNNEGSVVRNFEFVVSEASQTVTFSPPAEDIDVSERFDITVVTRGMEVPGIRVLISSKNTLSEALFEPLFEVFALTENTFIIPEGTLPGSGTYYVFTKVGLEWFAPEALVITPKVLFSATKVQMGGRLLLTPINFTLNPRLVSCEDLPPTVNLQKHSLPLGKIALEFGGTLALPSAVAVHVNNQEGPVGSRVLSLIPAPVPSLQIVLDKPGYFLRDEDVNFKIMLQNDTFTSQLSNLLFVTASGGCQFTITPVSITECHCRVFNILGLDPTITVTALGGSTASGLKLTATQSIQHKTARVLYSKKYSGVSILLEEPIILKGSSSRQFQEVLDLDLLGASWVLEGGVIEPFELAPSSVKGTINILSATKATLTLQGSPTVEGDTLTTFRLNPNLFTSVQSESFRELDATLRWLAPQIVWTPNAVYINKQSEQTYYSLNLTATSEVPFGESPTVSVDLPLTLTVLRVSDTLLNITGAGELSTEPTSETLSITFGAGAFQGVVTETVEGYSQSIKLKRAQDVVVPSNTFLKGNSISPVTSPLSLHLETISGVTFTEELLDNVFLWGAPSGLEVYVDKISPTEIQVFGVSSEPLEAEALTEMALELTPACFSQPPSPEGSLVPLTLEYEEVNPWLEFTSMDANTGLVSTKPSLTFKGDSEGYITHYLSVAPYDVAFTYKATEVDILTDTLKYITATGIPAGLRLRTFFHAYTPTEGDIDPDRGSTFLILALEGGPIEPVEVDISVVFGDECFDLFPANKVEGSSANFQISFNNIFAELICKPEVLLESTEVPGSIETESVISLKTAYYESKAYANIDAHSYIEATSESETFNGTRVEFVRTSTKASGLLGSVNLQSSFWGTWGNGLIVTVSADGETPEALEYVNPRANGLTCIVESKKDVILPSGYILELTRAGVTTASLTLYGVTLTSKIFGVVGNEMALEVVNDAPYGLQFEGLKVIFSLGGIPRTEEDFLQVLTSYGSLEWISVSGVGNPSFSMLEGVYPFFGGDQPEDSSELQGEVTSLKTTIDLGAARVTPKELTDWADQMLPGYPLVISGTGEITDLGEFILARRLEIRTAGQEIALDYFGSLELLSPIEEVGVWPIGTCTLQGGLEPKIACFNEDTDAKVLVLELGAYPYLDRELIATLPPDPGSVTTSQTLSLVSFIGSFRISEACEFELDGGGTPLENILRFSLTSLGVLPPETYVISGLPSGITGNIIGDTEGLVEYATLSALPLEGVEGTVYLAQDTRIQYTWEPLMERYRETSGAVRLSFTGTTTNFESTAVSVTFGPTAFEHMPPSVYESLEPVELKIQWISSAPQVIIKSLEQGPKPLRRVLQVSQHECQIKDCNHGHAIYESFQYFDATFELALLGTSVTWSSSEAILANIRTTDLLEGLTVAPSRISNTSIHVRVHGRAFRKQGLAPHKVGLRVLAGALVESIPTAKDTIVSSQLFIELLFDGTPITTPPKRYATKDTLNLEKTIKEIDARYELHTTTCTLDFSLRPPLDHQEDKLVLESRSKTEFSELNNFRKNASNVPIFRVLNFRTGLSRLISTRGAMNYLQEELTARFGAGEFNGAIKTVNYSHRSLISDLLPLTRTTKMWEVWQQGGPLERHYKEANTHAGATWVGPVGADFGLFGGVFGAEEYTAAGAHMPRLKPSPEGLRVRQTAQGNVYTTHFEVAPKFVPYTPNGLIKDGWESFRHGRDYIRPLNPQKAFKRVNCTEYHVGKVCKYNSSKGPAQKLFEGEQFLLVMVQELVSGGEIDFVSSSSSAFPKVFKHRFEVLHIETLNLLWVSDWSLEYPDNLGPVAPGEYNPDMLIPTKGRFTGATEFPEALFIKFSPESAKYAEVSVLTGITFIHRVPGVPTSNGWIVEIIREGTELQVTTGDKRVIINLGTTQMTYAEFKEWYYHPTILLSVTGVEGDTLVSTGEYELTGAEVEVSQRTLVLPLFPCKNPPEFSGTCRYAGIRTSQNPRNNQILVMDDVMYAISRAGYSTECTWQGGLPGQFIKQLPNDRVLYLEGGYLKMYAMRHRESMWGPLLGGSEGITFMYSYSSMELSGTDNYRDTFYKGVYTSYSCAAPVVYAGQQTFTSTPTALVQVVSFGKYHEVSKTISKLDYTYLECRVPGFYFRHARNDNIWNPIPTSCQEVLDQSKYAIHEDNLLLLRITTESGTKLTPRRRLSPSERVTKYIYARGSEENKEDYTTDAHRMHEDFIKDTKEYLKQYPWAKEAKWAKRRKMEYDLTVEVYGEDEAAWRYKDVDILKKANKPTPGEGYYEEVQAKIAWAKQSFGRVKEIHDDATGGKSWTDYVSK